MAYYLTHVTWNHSVFLYITTYTSYYTININEGKETCTYPQFTYMKCQQACYQICSTRIKSIRQSYHSNLLHFTTFRNTSWLKTTCKFTSASFQTTVQCVFRCTRYIIGHSDFRVNQKIQPCKPHLKIVTSA
jgi:hypothetical protein